MKNRIVSRSSKGLFKDEFSQLEYRIVGSRKIVQEIDDAIRAVEDKYEKSWDKWQGKYD